MENGRHNEPKTGQMLVTAQYSGRGLEYHTALQIVEYFRRALADFGYLGLSDHDMHEATQKALSDDVEGNGIAMCIKDWLESEFRPFKPSLMKVFGGNTVADQTSTKPVAKYSLKTELLTETYEIIETFRQELAAFGWSSLCYQDVFQIAKAGLRMSFFDDSVGEVDDALRPIAWHIHVLLQEAQYAHLRPILEAGLRYTPEAVLQAAVKAAKEKATDRVQ